MAPLLDPGADWLVEPLAEDAHGYVITLHPGPAVTSPVTACVRAFDAHGTEIPSQLFMCGGDDTDRRAILTPGHVVFCHIFVADQTRVARIAVFPERRDPVDVYRAGDPIGPRPATWVAPAKLDYRLDCAASAG